MQNAKVTTEIESEEGYDSALREIEQYFLRQPVAGTPEAVRFDALAKTLGVYEEKHWPIVRSVDKP